MFTVAASSEIYTLSLHDALPILIVGGWVSRTVTVKVQLLVLPLLSVAVLVTGLVAPGNDLQLAGQLIRLATAQQLSVAVTVKFTLLAHEPAAALTVMFAGQVMAG